VYDYESPNYVIDLPFVRIIAVAPKRDFPKGRAGTLSKGTLDWLEQRLAHAGRDCWIARHHPLRKTVMLTHLPGKIEIRFRDHRAVAWRALHGRRVQTVLVP